MKSLPKKSFDKAVAFISANARPLEQAQCDYHFGSGSIANVLTELKKFQNDDGGFGHGIEPDIRMPNSSPLATTLAFQVLREVRIPAEAPIVRAGIEYFERTYDQGIGGWDPTGPEVESYPRAPWWDYAPVDGALTPTKQSNPGAEICGYLSMFRAGELSPSLDSAVTNVLGVFEELPDDFELHALMCFMRMAEMMPGSVADRLMPKLSRGAHLVTGDKPEDWKNYGGRPLWFAQTPQSLLSPELQHAVSIQLDYEIDTQGDDGGWSPVWSYGDREAEMASAISEWAGWLTLRNLIAFNEWGRL
jgi:hypothetical protein